MEDILRHNIRLANEAIADVLETNLSSKKEDKILLDFRLHLLDICAEIKDIVEASEEDEEEELEEEEEEMDF